MMNSIRNRGVIALAMVSILGLAACHQQHDLESTPPAPTAPPPSVAAAAANSAATEAQKELDEKKKLLAAALAENDLINDPKGQWAVAATASSSFDDAKDQESYSPWQATGKPNVERYGAITEAWIPKQADAGIEWLKLDFATPVHATAIRIREPENPGAIARIELLEADGTSHTVWQGVDDTKYEDGQIGWLQKTFEATPYLVKGAKLTLATNVIPGNNPIDAVQLVGQ